MQMNTTRWFVGAFLWLTAGVCLGAPHKLRVNDPALAQSLVAQGGRLVADYGAFQVVETDQTPSLKPDDARIQAADRFDFIQLGSKSLNTRAPEARLLRKAVGAFTGRRLHLVHFAGPIKPEWHEALAQTGVKIISYLPQNAYLVYGDAAALARVQGWASAANSAQWDGAYLDEYKIHPKARSAQTDLFAVQLVGDAEANAATLQLIDRLKLAPVRNQYEALDYLNIVVSLPPERLNEIASQPDVVSILPYSEPRMLDERQDQIVAGNLTGTTPNMPVGPGYLAWLAGKGFRQAQFDASGLVVDVSDSGIDNGTLKPGHFGLYPLGDQSKPSRVAYSRHEGFNYVGGTLMGCNGHGNINAHIVAGYSAFSGGFPFTDSGGYSYGLGVCPFVKVGASVIFDPDSFTFPNYSALQSKAYSSGARVSNNSWGSMTSFGVYDIDAQTYDILVRDVGKSKNGRQMVIVFAAGNSGPDPFTASSPGTAKNVITVGASDNVRSLTPANGGSDISGTDGCSTTDSDASSADDVVDFSSRGPCNDGRIKPDLVAPGTHITGGVPEYNTVHTNGLGSALPCFLSNHTEVCGVYGASTSDAFFPLGQEFYTVSTGTSHAAPAVAGACALLRQYFINASLAAPSPAMTKAYLMNSARYLTGYGANDSLWSPNQGMGEVNLGTAFDGVPRILRDQSATDLITGTGQTRTFTGVISDPTKPFRVTLAWTDPAGSTIATYALVNDLDLTVTVGGNTYQGNVFSGAYSTTGGTRDSVNNVESVLLPPGLSGSFTVTITAANVTRDLVFGGMKPEQDFALVIYNATSATLPFAPLAASYSGLFYELSGVHFLSSGSFALTTTTKSNYTGTLLMGANRYPFSGKFNLSGFATNTIVRKGTNALALAFQMDTADNNRICGTVSNETWIADLQAERVAFNAANPSGLAGNYTLIVPGPADGNALTPQGDGCGTVIVTAAGLVKFSGTLAEGTKVAQSVGLVGAGRWPLYLSLYGGKGQILGWLTFTNTPDLGGTVSWIKPPISTAKYYPAAFDIETNVMGSVYQPPATSTSPALDFTNGVVVLTGGNLAGGITNNVTIQPKNKVADASLTNKLTLVLTTSQGMFKGTVLNPATKKAIAFSGALLQNQGWGSGYFLGTNQSGRVCFGPGP